MRGTIRFLPALSLICAVDLGIPVPRLLRTFERDDDGERFVVYGFALPEEAAAFMAYCWRVGFEPRLMTPAGSIMGLLGGGDEAGEL